MKKTKFKYAKGRSGIFWIKTAFGAKQTHGTEIGLPIKKHKFFMSYYPNDWDRHFAISEMSSGFELSCGQSEDECITMALIYIFAFGQKEFDKRIKSAAKEMKKWQTKH